jgi:hypothetical protein
MPVTRSVAIELGDGQGLDDGLKTILAAKGQALQDPGQHLTIMPDVLLPHDILILDVVLRTTCHGLGDRIPKHPLP